MPRTKNVVKLRKYPGIEYGPEVDAALEKVFEAQEALQIQNQRGFPFWDKRFNRKAHLLFLEEPRRALQEANERLSELCTQACEKAGCYDS